MKEITLYRTLVEDIIMKLYKKDTFYPIKMDKYLSSDLGYNLPEDCYYKEMIEMTKKILTKLNDEQIETLLLKI